jgi:F-type H+/Na+-transporting ATPase subunit alpha
MPDASFRVIRIVTAISVSPEKGQSIATRFAEHFGIKDYEVRLETDRSLIGGMVIFAGGFRYDYSIKGQLSRIVNKLKTQKSIGLASAENIFEPGGMIKENLIDALKSFDEMPIAPGAHDIFWDTEPLQVTEEETATHSMVDHFRESLESYMSSLAVDEIGQVLSIGDGVAYVRGIQNCRNNEMIMFTPQSFGIAMNLEENRVGVVLLQLDESIREGSICKRTGTTISVPAGLPMLGRVVDPLGSPIDGLGPIITAGRRPIESPAPAIIERQPVNRPLHTGITAIDAMTPIGRGQRELIIGDRQTGKTALAIDTIINQRGKHAYCVYVAIGQKMSTVADVVNTLIKHGAMDYTTVVVASASASVALQYIAPYAGCAIAEELMYHQNADVLVVYDDLSKHAQAYRAISLLLRRPPGREAYPGDVFYLHSRLLERSARLSDELGGGSITALPIVETQSGDISAYIPTNVISITDGQIYLESELFFSGQRPAINVGLSVSRVGGAAQTKAMKRVAGPLRINLAQYRELEAFSQFGSDLDDETISQLKIGERVIEVLKQPQYSPLAMEDQVIMLYLANQGVLAGLNKGDVRLFLHDFILSLRGSNPEMINEIATSGQFTDEAASVVDQVVKEYLKHWMREHEEYGTAG